MTPLTLRPYQEDGIQALLGILRRRKSALLADEMGTGKTVHAIKVAEHLQAKRILYACPASIRLKISREWDKWSEYEVGCITRGSDAERYQHKAVQVVSYELLSRVKGSFDFVIFDEAHYLKEYKSQRSRAARQVKAEYRLYMTGTPCPNGLIDGFYLLKALDPEHFRSKYDFGCRYCEVKTNWFTKREEFYGYQKKRMPELRKLLSSFMLRRRKKDVLPQLPTKNYQTVPLDVYRGREFRLSEGEVSGALEAISKGSEHVATRRRELGLAKIQAVASYALEILAEKRRLVIFTYHREVNWLLAGHLMEHGATILSITGDTPHRERDRIVQEFQGDLAKRIVLVAQVEAAGIGIELTASDICCFAELDYRPHVMLQAMDRLHRIGQEKSVDVQYLIAAGSMDEQIIDSLREKIESSKEALR